MSWMDIFRKKPRDPYGAVIVNDVPPQTGNPSVPLITQVTEHRPGHDKKTYTAKEVAKAGVDDVEVQRLVQVITAKAYVAAQEGHTSIGHRDENANLLKRAGEQLSDMGYDVIFNPGGRTNNGYYYSSPLLSISW